MSFDGIVTRCVSTHLQQALVGGKINKVYQISKYELLFYVRANYQNLKFLISCHPNNARIALTMENYPTPLVPSQLTMTLRKHLEGAFIKEIKQLGFERIVEISILGRNEMGDDISFRLIVEIMGKHANAILCRQDGKIIDALKRINPDMSTVRVVQPGVAYQYPPLHEHKKDPLSFQHHAYEKMYLDYAGMSPALCRELVYRESQQEKIEGLLEDALQEGQLYLSYKDGKEDYHLIPFKHFGDHIQAYPLFQGLDHFYRKKDENDRIKQQTSDLNHFLKNEKTKSENKLAKLEQELFECTNCDDLKLKGELLYSQLHLVQKGMKSVTLNNYYDNQPITVELDIRLDGKSNAKKYFQRYQKAKNALAYLQVQIKKTKEELEYFDTLLEQMKHVGLYDALEIKEELENLGYLRKKKKKEPKRKKQQPHFDTYTSKDGISIYVGKNNIQNDYLTFKMARRQYYWFHVKDMPGSHVIIASDSLDEYHIRLAANLAALYSKASSSSSVPVNYTQVQNLKKAPGGILGKVILGRYKTIYIDPDPIILEQITKK